MRVVVTGSNGLVGTRLVHRLEERGHEVTKFTRADVELSDAKSVQIAVDRAQPEVIFNPASMTEVDKCESDPDRAFRDNVQAAANLASASRKIGAHLVHVSTDYVFDGNHGPYLESDVANPRGVYAKTKRMGEEAVETLGGSFAIARTAVVYGWPQAARSNFGAWLATQLAEGEPVKLFSDQFVSPSLAVNVADMLVEIGERKLDGIWNVAGAEVVSRVEFGLTFCKELGFDPKLVIPTRLAEMNLASPRPMHSGLIVEKAIKVLENKPLGIVESVRRFRQLYNANKSGGR
jgi:dTDP-4-dehydrorhamnose reductase